MIWIFFILSTVAPQGPMMLLNLLWLDHLIQHYRRSRKKFTIMEVKME